MPAYEFICGRCDRVLEISHPIAESHPHWHGSCGGPLVQVIHAPAVHGCGASGVSRDMERDRNRDSEAYRRLRKDGVQPKGVKGAAEIEQRAGERVEVEHDTVWESRKAAHRAQEHADALP